MWFVIPPSSLEGGQKCVEHQSTTTTIPLATPAVQGWARIGVPAEPALHPEKQFYHTPHPCNNNKEYSKH
jgi:hypothetical protein